MVDRGIEVVLAAPVPDGTEPLALGYLSAALRAAGHAPHVVAIRDWRDLEAAARLVAARAPLLVGVSLPSGPGAIDGVAFAVRLRHLGWTGHLTCGGTWATLCRRRLLENVPAVDSVVRHDGEIPLVALADRLAAGAGCEGISGVTTRAGDGAPAPVEAPAPARRPERGEAKRYAGVPSAKISAVRGCPHGCRYCGLAALRRERLAECSHRSPGTPAAVGSAAGIRRRPVEDVADEMAHLYRERGVRFFHFVDENHLSPDPREAEVAVRGLAAALDRRGVRRRAVSMMLRADDAAEPVVEALAELGLVRALLGVESSCDDALRALGRGSRANGNAAAMERLARRGVRFHFNVLLVHPDSTLDSIRREIAALGEVRGGLLDPFRVEPFEGTELFDRLAREGRLRGGPFVWHYEIADPRAEAFARAFDGLRRVSMGSIPLTSFAYEVLGVLAVAEKLGMVKVDGAALRAESERLVARHNRLWLDLLERATALAAEGDAADAAALSAEGRTEAARLTLEFEGLRRRVETCCRRRLIAEIAAPRSAAAVALALGVLGGGCYASYRVESAADGAGDDAALDAGDAPDVAEAGCTAEDRREEFEAIEDTAIRAGCRPICLGEDFYRYRFVLDAEGRVTDVERDDGVAIPEDLRRCYREALAGQTFPCLAEYPYWEPCTVLLA